MVFGQNKSGKTVKSIGKQLVSMSEKGLDAISDTDTLYNLVTTLSPTITLFVTGHPQFAGILFTGVMLLLFRRKMAVTVTDKLLAIINETVGETEIDKLISTEEFVTVYSELFASLVKEVSTDKSEILYKFFSNFVKSPQESKHYLSKMLFVLTQLTADQYEFIKHIHNDLPAEYVERNKKINMTLEKAVADVWHANNAQMNFVLEGKFTSKQLFEIIDALHSYGIITGTTMSNDVFGMNGLTTFGESFIKYIL